MYVSIVNISTNLERITKVTNIMFVISLKVNDHYETNNSFMTFCLDYNYSQSITFELIEHLIATLHLSFDWNSVSASEGISANFLHQKEVFKLIYNIIHFEVIVFSSGFFLI